MSRKDLAPWSARDDRPRFSVVGKIPRPVVFDGAVFRYAVDSAPNGVLVCDHDGTILFANHQIETMFGYAGDELVGRPMHVIVPNGNGHPRGLRKDGSLVPVEIGLSNVDDHGDGFVVASVVDVTERQALREEIHDGLVKRLTFERVLSSLAARFVHVASPDLGMAIADSQRQVVEALDLDRSTLWTMDDSGEIACAYSWTRPGLPIVPNGLLAKDVTPGVLEYARTGEPLALNDAAEWPHAIDRACFDRYCTRSTFVVPLKTDGRLTGLLWFTTVRTHRTWPLELQERLRLLALVFEHALARKRGEDALTKALAEVKLLRDQLTAENSQLRSEVKSLRVPRLVATESLAARRVLAEIEPVAPTNATVLLLGETGCGKEVFAQLIHEMSRRHQRPMVRVNCGAIPSALIESELFGRERGAYTGALSKQIGRFEFADGATIFLDEIGELPLEAQVKLLRVLQDKVIERLGGNQPIKVDVRIIAATNRDLDKAVQERAFREDLYYRLNVYPITVPPLRERVEDIPVLAWTFVDEFSKAFGKRIDSIAAESMAALRQYKWPGNVRELRNQVERAVIMATGPRLTIDPPRNSPSIRHTTTNLNEVEVRHIREILEASGWRVRGIGGAAERLGMKPTTLESRMAKLGIRRAQA
jgi:transcriptional regulator with GAF, ATPase, and Fis domain